LTEKAHPAPAVTMTTAAMTGPITWPRMNWSVFSPTASVTSSRGTSPGRIEMIDGFAIA
jgi:hypothetical protein